MEDKPRPKIFNMKWGRSCRSCGTGGGGGGDPEAWGGLLFLLLVLVPTVVFGVYLWLNARGVQIGEQACAWDNEERQYVASVQLRNNESVFKVVSLRIQGHFRPAPGQEWPDPSLKVRYEDISNWQTVELEPESSANVVAQFPLPGVERFDCKAEAWIVGQRRFEERPSPEALQAVRGAV